MTDRSRLSVVACAAACALSACSLAPTYKRPDVDLNQTWSTSAGVADASQLQDMAWESLYTDAYLRGLIRAALARNHDMRIAVGRMQEARAMWGVQGADQLPSATMSLGRTESLTPAGILNTSATPVRLNRYDANVNLVSFEVDFWTRGRLDASSEVKLPRQRTRPTCGANGAHQRCGQWPLFSPRLRAAQPVVQTNSPRASAVV